MSRLHRLCSASRLASSRHLARSRVLFIFNYQASVGKSRCCLSATSVCTCKWNYCSGFPKPGLTSAELQPYLENLVWYPAADERHAGPTSILLDPSNLIAHL
eukprot:361200-Chlamydomonas_euryale.AAC.15